MTELTLAFGRFTMDALLEAVRSGPGAAAEQAVWGIAYCYGNRLEVLRSQHPAAQDPEFARLGDLRTDMAAVIAESGVTRASGREVQPFVRREGGRVWAFCHHGTVSAPEKLDTGGRIVDSRNPSEKLFLHLLARLDPSKPDESVTAALDGLSGETALSCCLVSCDTLVVASWDTAPDAAARPLWLGRSELLRWVSARPLERLQEAAWERLSSRAVFAVSRTRSERA